MKPEIIDSEVLSAGEVIRQPVASGPGYWVGAPGVYRDAEEGAFYLTYRIRRPRGVEPDRGGEARIAHSTDGIRFEDVWSVTKDRFPTASIERCAIRRGRDGLWRCFACCVDADGKWCVSVIRAQEINQLDASRAQPLFNADMLGLEGVKDPWIFEHGKNYVMILSVAVATAETSDASHDTKDIYNTGQCKSATAMAVSADLDEWDWQGIVFAPEGKAWDGYCRRINSIYERDGRFMAFYDGSSSLRENYEEKTGLAESADLKQWRCLTPEGPALTSPHSSGSLRYMDVQVVGQDAYVYYEFTRADGSHDLRVLKSDVQRLPG